MAVLLELHNTGDPGVGAKVQAMVEHALSDRTGDWRGVDPLVLAKTTSWEMKVEDRTGLSGHTH